ncbi:uncharacterized protein LOC132278389 isoform X2 [Cornus florida]|uniref:uncharacterized protein LOC132278389 isoform X2 n=1 Tax=Cornus florida TaxID=4283 RepID=UPI00289C0126|nr:uncharacterized protein LOC132278389 isoform X2 [Cornus florida]
MMMVSSSSALPNPIIDGAIFFSNHHHHHPATTIFKWGLRREQDARLVTRRAEAQAFRVLANPNVCITQGFHMYNDGIFGLNMLKDMFRMHMRQQRFMLHGYGSRNEIRPNLKNRIVIAIAEKWT